MSATSVPIHSTLVQGHVDFWKDPQWSACNEVVLIANNFSKLEQEAQV